MAEVYPSDNDLLNITGDSETGVEYIPTGTAPYYLHFRKLLYRLLLVARRGNDLRVFDEGGLDVGVKSGKFWMGADLISYAGSSGNLLADDKASIYVYIDSSGNLVTNEYSVWPDMSVSRHVRLAVVTTSSGEIASIVDARGHHSIAVPSGGGSVVIEAHTSDDTLTEAESGSVHSNRGATGIVTITLPAAASAGTVFTFCVQEAQQFRVDPGTATIRDTSGQTADKYKWADAVGECITLIADSNSDWAVTSKGGFWSEEG